MKYNTKRIAEVQKNKNILTDSEINNEKILHSLLRAFVAQTRGAGKSASLL